MCVEQNTVEMVVHIFRLLKMSGHKFSMVTYR